MSNESNRRGSCLCGGVRVSASMRESSLGACHCSRCRKWSGGPFMELECGSEVSFEGEANIRVFASTQWAVRAFCKVCGSHIYMKSKDSAQYGIPVGLFEDSAGIVFDRQVFHDKKPSYYSFANKTRNITSDYIYEHFPECRDDSDAKKD